MAAMQISFSNTNVYSYWYLAIISIDSPSLLVYLLTLSYSTLNNPSNSRAPESANICLIIDSLDFLLNSSIILSPNCVFLSDVSSILIWPSTTEPCNVLIIFLMSG